MPPLITRTVRYLFSLCGLEVSRKVRDAPVQAPSEAPPPEPSEADVLRARMVPRQSMHQLAAHVKARGFEPATVIDVGVGRGTDWLYPTFRDHRFLLVEPLKEFTEDLERLSAANDSHFVIAAAGAAPGEYTLSFDPRHLTNASMFPSDGPTKHEERTVPVVTLDDLRREHSLTGPYLLKVDVQGGELEVLKGATEILQSTEIVFLEASLFAIRRGWPLFDEIVGFMKTRGFVVYDLVEGHNRPLDGDRAQIDVAFVKESGYFRTTNVWATGEQIETLRNP